MTLRYCAQGTDADGLDKGSVCMQWRRVFGRGPSWRWALPLPPDASSDLPLFSTPTLV